MNEDQAKKMISVLNDIASNTSSTESNTSLLDTKLDQLINEIIKLRKAVENQ